MIQDDLMSDEARIINKEALDAYVNNGMALSSQVAEIKVSLAKLFKRSE
jgi:hypothetical protein